MSLWPETNEKSWGVSDKPGNILSLKESTTFWTDCRPISLNYCGVAYKQKWQKIVLAIPNPAPWQRLAEQCKAQLFFCYVTFSRYCTCATLLSSSSICFPNKGFRKSKHRKIIISSFFFQKESANKVFCFIRLLNLNMGGWQLEASKMALYMVFPVGLFYYFNQAEYFEDWMINLRREMYPAERKVNKKAFEDTIREMKEKREQEYLRLLEEKDIKSNQWIVVKFPLEFCIKTFMYFNPCC